jgi:hypothetical protein
MKAISARSSMRGEVSITGQWTEPFPSNLSTAGIRRAASMEKGGMVEEVVGQSAAVLNGMRKRIVPFRYKLCPDPGKKHPTK